MENDQLDPQIEKLLKEVKLKEPRRQEMTDYLSGVRSKITIKQNQTHFYFVPAGIVLVVILVLSGFIYWLIQNQSKEENPVTTVAKISAPIAKSISVSNSLSLEEEMAILGAFSDEYPNGTSDLLGDEESMEDLVLMDEIEFTVTPAQSTSFGS